MEIKSSNACIHPYRIPLAVDIVLIRRQLASFIFSGIASLVLVLVRLNDDVDCIEYNGSLLNMIEYLRTD